jgi:hypothetical protein
MQEEEALLRSLSGQAVADCTPEKAYEVFILVGNARQESQPLRTRSLGLVRDWCQSCMKILPAMKEQLPGLEVYRAVRHIQQPGIPVEVGRANRYPFLSPG